MNCLFFNYDTNELITTVRLNKVKNGLSDFTDIIRKRQQTKDILGIGFPCNLKHNGFGLGIREYKYRDGYIHTINSKEKMEAIEKINNLKTNKNTYIYGQNSSPMNPPEYISYYDENYNEQKTNLRVSAYAYPEGFVLSVGKNSHDIFGNVSKMYFDKITSVNFKSKEKGKCRKFPTIKAMLDYVKEKQSIFEYVVKRHGYFFTWEFASPEFEEDVKKWSKKKQNSESLAKIELNKLLDKINNCDEDEPNDYPLPTSSIANDEDMKEEALLRIEKLNFIGSVKKKFRNNVLMQSEFGGILYFLDNDAKLAVEEVKKEGYLPYHVIVNDLEFGKTYTVLYVSPNTNEWDMERPRKDGHITAYVYNASQPLFSEFGDVCIEAANGGLIRVA